jgi:hypothetical protein
MVEQRSPALVGDDLVARLSGPRQRKNFHFGMMAHF